MKQYVRMNMLLYKEICMQPVSNWDGVCNSVFRNESGHFLKVSWQDYAKRFS